MKLLRLILVAFVPVFLPACGSQASVQPVIATGSLDTAEAYLRRGDSYSDIQDYDRAIADYNRGAAYMASGYPEQAIGDLDRALELQPDFPQAFTNRSNAHLRLGHLG